MSRDKHEPAPNKEDSPRELVVVSVAAALLIYSTSDLYLTCHEVDFLSKPPL